jgi:AcrR family transcriptional regulator
MWHRLFWWLFSVLAVVFGPRIRSGRSKGEAMNKTAVIDKRATPRRAARAGRPPRELAGEVDARILDAARRVFLERGLAGASIDEIASLASAGKPTIYARFPGKEALFAAVVMRNVEHNLARFASDPPKEETIEERLAAVAASLLQWALGGDTVDLMRLGIAEARRFPDLASHVHRLARERGEEAVGRLLAEAAAQSEALGSLAAFAPDRLAATTRFFVDLVFMPLIMQALFGAKLKLLHAQIGHHVPRSVAFFLAACRNGGIS